MAKKKDEKPQYIQPDEKDPINVLLDEVLKHHPHLEEAKIALAYRSGWKADVDGLRTLGKCKKVSPVEKLFHGFDFVIIVNRDAWDLLDDGQKRALLDHELCHAQVRLDENGNHVIDEDGHPCWRVRKHDLEEFRDVVQRHGCYKQDILSFVRDVMAAKGTPLLEGEKRPI